MEKEEAVVRVRDLMTGDIICVSPEDSVMKAAKAMDDRDVSSILVKSHDEFSGIIADRDIIKRVVSKGLDPTKVSVHEVMSSPIVTISSEATIDELLRKWQTTTCEDSWSSRISGGSG